MSNPKQSFNKEATIYRIKNEHHVCPFGLKALDLLKKNGYKIIDKTLSNESDIEQFKEKNNVSTTPQVYIDGHKIGGYDKLRIYFGLKVNDKSEVSYRPIIAIFTMTALMALASVIALYQSLSISILTPLFETFMALSIGVLSILKLQDIESFSNQFLGYDLLAKRALPYAYIYPFAEAFVSIGMLAKFFTPVIAGVALFIGIIGAISVFKAVYIDKRELKCACVGGNSNVPLGFVSLTENLMMIVMGIWLLV